ncbi:MAG: 3-hydroxyisobutyrate dehydrogenase [Gammaproteobacteria bacterium RIFCSPHIGHO2_12_FULL_42_13]|nr:MAG: 3-hydroxyisobutyrate dehydrogenase [Gammaproteobacteria bacterium RIFCSPHIGHO2_12_FULL_42_13]
MTTIGFIGLGHMGRPMAENLLKAGHAVIVYDIVKAAMEALTKAGASAAPTVAALANAADVIITSLQTSQQVNDICLRPDGIFSNARQGLLYIDTSSIDMVATRALHSEAERLQIAMLDAPVSGGVAGAKAASLTIMVGGEETAFERALPILSQLGKKIVHAGASGSGQAAKICNNLLLGISMIGVAESFTLAEKLGLDAKKFFEISSNASGQCWSMTSYCPVPGILPEAPASNGYQPGFMAKMMLKDLRLGQHAAEAVQSALPLGSLAAELYELYVNQGFGETDFSGIINFIGSKG